MKGEFRLGISTYFDSFGFIRKHKLGYFYLIPILLMLLLSVAAWFGIVAVVDYVNPIVSNWIGADPLPGTGFWDQVLNFFKDAGKYLVSFVVFASLLYVFHKVSKYVILILMSPIMALISEKVEEKVTGNSYPFSWQQLMRDVVRGSLLALRNMFIELVITLVLLGINLALTMFLGPLTFLSTPIVSIVLFFVSAYFFGFSTLDYALERRKTGVKDTVAFVRQHKQLAIANGSFFALWLMIPILGTYVGAIIAPVTCTVGATLAFLEIEKRNQLTA